MANTQNNSVNETNIDGNNSLQIYPNPNNAQSSLNIDINAEEQGSIIITDVLGKQLFAKLINKGSTNLSTTKSELNISAGVYFVTLQLNKKTITQKLIIN